MICGKCGLEVFWEMDHKAGHVNCYNRTDGKIHWDTCSETRTREAIKNGIPFTEPFGHGYIVPDKKRGGNIDMYMVQRSGWIKGKLYVDTGDRSIPWKK